MMCESEQSSAKMLTYFLETHASGSGILIFGDPEGSLCEGVGRKELVGVPPVKTVRAKVHE